MSLKTMLISMSMSCRQNYITVHQGKGYKKWIKVKVIYWETVTKKVQKELTIAIYNYEKVDQWK